MKGVKAPELEYYKKLILWIYTLKTKPGQSGRVSGDLRSSLMTKQTDCFSSLWSFYRFVVNWNTYTMHIHVKLISVVRADCSTKRHGISVIWIIKIIP